MDEMNDDPSEICSYTVNRVIHEGIGDLNKKRKILDELLGLPPPKWKFRDRGGFFVEHSEMDSNSMVGESNSASSPSTESTSQTDLPSSQIQSSSFASQSFSSSRHESNISLKDDTVSSSDSTSMEEENSDKEEDESPFLKGQGLLGNFGDDTYSEHEIEEFLDFKSEELMLYSNAATSDTYVLSSGRWNINKDAFGRRGVKEPTIDQEFEQYFSTLML